ncbi:MAG: alanine racemase [Succinivibrio sp.]|nr:alanine racemase [Succinivibrio sp.]
MNHSLQNCERFNTPCYIFDEETLLSTVALVRQSLGANFALCYSLKANPFILKSVVGAVDRLEVCSHGEFLICKAWAVPPERIFYTGVNKQGCEIAEALAYGVRHFNLESLRQYEILQDAARQAQVCCRVYVRLNAGNQFGMSMTDLLAVIGACRDTADSCLEVAGVHYFAGTAQKRGRRQKQLSELQECLKAVRPLLTEPVEVEYGPGLGVRYFADEAEAPDEQVLRELTSDLAAVADCRHERWTIELGRFLSAPCGSYLTAVADLKSAGGCSYVILDGGMHQLSYYGQILGMRQPLIRHYGTGGPAQRYLLCGSLCTTADVLAKGVELPQLHLRDRLQFLRCGAYACTEAPGLFLSRNLPGLYLIRADGRVELIRDTLPTYPLNMEEIR